MIKGFVSRLNNKPLRIISLSFIFIVLLMIPFIISSNYLISIFVNCFIFAALGLAWNLISGYGGQISWCHSAFVAIGGYVGILSYNQFGISPFLSLILAILLSYIISTIIGLVSFRYRGPFFAITTIAFGEIVRVLLLHYVDFTGGSRGISVRFDNPSLINLLFRNHIPFYYIMLLLMIFLVCITVIFEKSKMGFYLRAIKNDEDAAISLGLKTNRIKLLTFQLSAILTTALGVFYAFFLTYIEPQSISGLDLSVKIGSIAIIGGVGTIVGPILGSFVMIPLIEISGKILGSIGGAQLLYGLTLILVVLIEPRGLRTIFSKDSILHNIINQEINKLKSYRKPKILK